VTALDGPSLAVIAVVGPTGSGKTSLAIELAERLDTEVVGADSMQIYRGMAIGTAAPIPAEQDRIRHHFVGVINPDEQMSAGVYGEQARAVVDDLNARGKPAVVAGGSGLYLSALLDGLFDGPPADATIRARLQREAAERGNAHLMTKLEQVDPVYAALLTSENDLVRVVRALEVFELSGQPFSELHAAHQSQQQTLDALIVAPQFADRETLYARIGARVDAMVAAGWIDEVKTLIANGYGEHLGRLKALGYREVLRALRGIQSMEDAIEQTKMHHRRYAKRQLTWFRADDRIHWLERACARTVAELADETLALAEARAGA